ncbi:MAG: 30S ribosomal protein S3 [Candidatus Berkelbacteria bacterium]|nr:30S ribosomal protein S3 [Candidatus Berkelbacteria bacterium]MCR4307599.1 30S ribosomal protein S3 [Candidatus Berkelbacteria bacterium]
MGHKINPHSNRMSITSAWQSRWFGGNKFKEYLVSDIKIRDYIQKKLNNAGVKSVTIIRSRDKLAIEVITSKPGLVIGRGGQGITDLKAQVQKLFYPAGIPAIRIDIVEDRNPELSAELVAQNIGNQIERRIPYRRACKQALEKTMAKNAKGIKIIVSGRLNGAEIARTEKFQTGSIPLSRFNINIDHAVYHAKTTYGVTGVKVWVNLGPHQIIEEEK